MAEVLQPVLSKARATVLFLEVLQRVLFFPFTSACQARAVVLQHAYSVTRNASVLDFDERKLEHQERNKAKGYYANDELRERAT